MPKADIAIITVIPEEYAAIIEKLKSRGCSLDPDPGSSNCPNLYGWVTGELHDALGRKYRLVVAAAILPGQTRMANAVSETVTRYKPRSVLLVGIAGGFNRDGLNKGDIAISTAIYDYDYGKIAAEFQPRLDFTYQVDSALLTSAVTLHIRDNRWTDWDMNLRPDGAQVVPKVIQGAVASGNKVVDDATNAFFAQVLLAWPRLLAVEMEGAGAASAIEIARSKNHKVGFLMVRGISDMPLLASENSAVISSEEGNKAERDTWKRYAAAVAASFTVHWITQAWPIRPGRRPSKTVTLPIPDEEEDGDGPPPSVTSGPSELGSSGAPDPFISEADTSIWLGFKKHSIPLPQLPSDTARGDAAVYRMMLAKVLEHLDKTSASPSSGLDTELEVIKEILDRHDPAVAEAKLNELETRAADQLSPHQWYQLKALRSRILSGRGKWEEAGRALIDAKRLMPTTERARINEALGYELLGDREKAHVLATELRTEYTQSVKLVSIWIRTAPSSVSFTSIAAVAASFAKDDEEINLGLAYRAFLENRFPDALPFARRATEIHPNSPQAWFVLGETKHAIGFQSNTDHQQLLLHEAAENYDQAAQLAHTQKLPGLEAAIRVNRGRVRHLLGDQRAEADFLAAIELGPPDQGFRTEYAGFLVDLERYSEALHTLAAEKGTPTRMHLFYEAASRYGRNSNNDRTRAIEILGQLILAEPFDRWADAHVLVVNWAVENKTQPAAQAMINGTKLREINPFVYHTLCGWLLSSQGNTEPAKAEFRLSLAAMTDAVSRTHVFLLAQALVSVGDDEIALPLLERCYRPGVFNDECRKLLDCARRLKRHDVSIGVCRELRKAGVTEPQVVLTEISLLQLYNPHEALGVAQEYLSKHPENRHVILWQSFLALRLDRPELVVSDVSLLPTVNDLTPEGGGLVIAILSETKQYYAALKYAYEVLRVHFDNEFAHGQFIAHFLQLSERCPELKAGGAAGPGMAVCYRGEHDETDKWIVIEESVDPNLALDELSPDHPVSRALTNRKVGDTVVVDDSGIQPRAVTIGQVFHKFVYRFQDCINQYQVRFPDGSAVQMVHLGSQDRFDLSPIVKSLQDRRKYIEKLDQHYRTGPLPFSLYAQLVARNEFETWAHLVSNATLGIRCFDGRADQISDGMELASRSQTIILDVTAIITLANVELLHVLRGAARKFVVALTTFDRIQEIIERAKDEKPATGSLHLTEDGSLGRVESTPEQKEQHIAFLVGVCNAIRESCEIRPCSELVQISPKQREDLTQAIGRHNLDSLLIARQPEAALWSDDLIMGILGRSEFQIRRVWTQAVLFMLQGEGALTAVEFDHAVAKLVGWYYQ